MTVFFVFYFFVIGLVMGSFFNVVGLRVPNGQSIVRPRSHCTKCNRTLRFSELIPVFSYILQKGRCRGCGTKISPIYPIIELLTASLFAYSFYQYGWSLEFLGSLLLISLLIIIFVSDIIYMVIPDKVLLFFLILFVIYRFVYPIDPWWSSVLGGIVGFTLLMLIAIISKGGMGGGDIKLFAVLGIFLGWQTMLVAFFFSIFLGACIGVLLLASKQIKRKQQIPFGPYIVAGTIVAYFIGDEILKWYFHF